MEKKLLVICWKRQALTELRGMRDTWNADWKADGMDLQYVKVYAVDSKGRVVPATEGEVTFEVSGEARLIAVDNGDHMTDELFSGNHKKLHQGFVIVEM